MRFAFRVLIRFVDGHHVDRPRPTTAFGSRAAELGKIKHIVIILQENRSFDHYFGTYPGADGIPMANGVPTVCVNDPASGVCIKPFHDSTDKNNGGPHGQSNSTADVDNGKMDGFIAQAELAQKGCANPNNPACAGAGLVDVMGYHDNREIPNYWTYAHNFVLQDHMFEPNASWSEPDHLFLVSEWSAHCTAVDVASSCVNALQTPLVGAGVSGSIRVDRPHVPAAQGRCELEVLRGARGRSPTATTMPHSVRPCRSSRLRRASGTRCPASPRCSLDSQLVNIQTLDKFETDVAAGTLPSVSWIGPNSAVSEHPTALDRAPDRTT